MHRNSPPNKLVIDTSGHPGLDGRNGDQGAKGSYEGGDGEMGKAGGHGTDGKSARDIHLHLSVHDSNVDVNADKISAQLPLGDPSAEITIRAKGGKGGEGGLGGQGGKGTKGRKGQDATQYSYGTNGYPGGDGGKGGRGGDGGHGGNGGNLVVNVAPQDTDLLMLLNETALSGGQGGKGGRGGKGGEGGLGGQGGNSYHWHETEYHTTYDSEGCPHSEIYTTSHTNEGGTQGVAGSRGETGQAGTDGQAGRSGDLVINVQGEQTYAGRYDLAIDSLTPPHSADGVIEPGEWLAVQELTVQNTGKMPTPFHHPIHFSLTNNRWVEFHQQDTVSLTSSIHPSQKATLSDGLRFRVKEAGPAIPAVDATFRQISPLGINAEVSRVNQRFSTVERQKESFEIRYPLEISTVSAPPTVSLEEEAPVVMKIRNISNQPIGIRAPQPRLANIDFSLTGGVGGHMVEFSTAEENFSRSHDMGPLITQHCILLQPEQEAYFAGTLKFNGDTPLYTQAHFSCQLNLGKLDKPLEEQEAIQKRNFRIQVADSFRYDPDADIVLVTNNNTKEETVKRWKGLADRLGKPLSIWNTSLYSGLSYTQKRADGGSFMDDMQGKVIVILNNEMMIKDETKHSTECLDAMEILSAAKQANISTYVIGNNFEIEKSLRPLTPISQNDSEQEVKDRFMFWKRPGEGKLAEKAKTLNKQIHKDNPDKRYVSLYSFNAEKKSGFSLRPEWTLGKVETRETLDRTQSHIAHRYTTEGFDPVSVDLFNLIKLMPFAKKLDYLENCQDRDCIELVKKAILTDLANELLAFAKYKWNGGYSTSKLKTVLINLRTLSEHQFTNKDHLRDVLLQHEYFANQLPTTSDKYFFPCLCRRTRLRNVTNERIKRMINEHLPDQDLSEQRKMIKRQYQHYSRELLFKEFSNPYADQTTFDNQTKLEKVENIKDIHYRSNPSQFFERHNVFASAEERHRAIDELKEDCKFELAMRN